MNFGGTTCVATTSTTFVPQPANLRTAGDACGPLLGASLSPPTSQPGRLVLHIADDPIAPSSMFAALAFGAQPLRLGATCNPGLVAAGWIPVTPAAGGLDLTIPLDAALVGTVHVQHVGLQLPFLLQWSNRVTLALPLSALANRSFVGLTILLRCPSHVP